MKWKTHAQERALQRYNKDLTMLDMNNIIKIIQNNQHTPLGCRKEDKNKKFCYLKYNHIQYKILYKINKKKCRIITIYPFDVDEYNNIEEQKKLERIQKAISFLEKEGYTICKHS